VFSIDHKAYESSFIGLFTVDPFDSTMRTKENVVLVRKDLSEAINLFESQESIQIMGKVLQTTSNNDFLFSFINNNVLVHDLGASPVFVGSFDVNKDCVVSRARENEASNALMF